MQLLRTSERSSFKTCRQQWYWGFVDRLKPAVAPPALRFGDLVHKSLAAYYKPGVRRGPKPALTFEELYERELKQANAIGFRDDDGKWRDAGQLGVVMLEGYHDRYHSRDQEWKVIASERTFQWGIRDPDTGKSLVKYVGTFDGVWENREKGFLIFSEHKTTAKIEKSYEHLQMDEQASSYWTFGPAWLVKAGVLKPEDKDRFRYILYNFLRKAEPDGRDTDADGRALNQDGTVSKSQPSPLFYREPILRDEHSRRIQYARVIEEARQMAEARADPSKAYKNPGPMYNPNCRGCSYRSMCLMHEIGADWEAIRDGTMIEWDPYKDHLDPHGDLVIGGS